MKTIFEHVEHIKTKPHHVRKNIAFMSATVGTALIALVWLVGNVSSGAFAFKPTSFADIAHPEGLQTSNGFSSTDALAGVGAVSGGTTARIEIVDTASSTRPTQKAEQTTIPF